MKILAFSLLLAVLCACTDPDRNMSGAEGAAAGKSVVAFLQAYQAQHFRGLPDTNQGQESVRGCAQPADHVGADACGELLNQRAVIGHDEIALRHKAWKAVDADLTKRMGKPTGKCGKPKSALAAAVCTWARGQFRVVRIVSLYNEEQWSHKYELSRR